MKQGEGIVLVVSGPSGAGKGTLCQKLLKSWPHMCYSVSVTSRKPRPGEVHGVNYYFVSEEEFQRTLAEKGFLEWAKVYDNYYGTPWSQVQEVIASGRDIILEIEMQGAMQVKEHYKDGVFVFVVPPTKDDLKKRIEARGTENPEEIEKRLKNVEREMSYISRYDYIVVNEDTENAVETLKAIIMAEKCRPGRIQWQFVS